MCKNNREYVDPLVSATMQSMQFRGVVANKLHSERTQILNMKHFSDIRTLQHLRIKKECKRFVALGES